MQHASNENGGYLLWDYNSGTLTPGEGSQTVPDEPGALSQSEPGNNWIVSWTAPDSDIGSVSFQLVGNAVNGNGQFDGGDLWNILSFSISAPDTTFEDDSDNLQLRTISVGDYDSLFVAEEDPAAFEAERQEGIAEDFLTMETYSIGLLVNHNNWCSCSRRVLREEIWWRTSSFGHESCCAARFQKRCFIGCYNLIVCLVTRFFSIMGNYPSNWNDNAMGNIWCISHYCPSKSSKAIYRFSVRC